MKRIYFFFILISLTFSSCFGWGGSSSGGYSWNEGDAVKSPVQVKDEGISMQSPQGFKSLGKIYYQPPFLFINETGRGLHIIDNSDPYSPEKVKFIKIPGNLDLAMKGNYLYVNHMRDMVLLRIDKDEVVELQRLKNAFNDKHGNDEYPKNYRGYFICPDPEEGKVIYWEDIIADEEPNCRI